MLYTRVLNNNRDFVSLYRKGLFTRSGGVSVCFRQNNRPFNRLGITVGKKVGNAVCRNRVKRIIRTAYRLCETDFPIGIDIVIIADRRLNTVKSDELCSRLKKRIVPEIEKSLRARLGRDSRNHEIK